MNLFKRLFKFGSAEAHSALDQLEDPIKMSEQAIRDLKRDLDKSIQSLAEVKAIAIRSRRELETATAEAEDYKVKAMTLVQKAASGELDQAEADRLASRALEQQGQAQQQAERQRGEKDKYDRLAADLEHKIQDLKGQIGQWENELKTLKARAKVSSATKKINRQMAQVDSSSTIATLEKMRSKVEEEEALAESYGSMIGSSRSLDDEIDQAIGGSASGSDALAKLKAEMAASSGKTEPGA
ncbi:PspA/IM30 family protein [Marinobacter xestospongiae]|uniref:PspA/IM30 family protein n=1 Tax=Marinobacter xestospongiae TaxID=994319 RepID=A0ABU3VZL5_9GAMM|nr:PspA/IM30 family protein [Marinobacter xestospongiae]MDV2079606.1 PspA/IM30 family protein [Marinobacter xestospongiae]